MATHGARVVGRRDGAKAARKARESSAPSRKAAGKIEAQSPISSKFGHLFSTSSLLSLARVAGALAGFVTQVVLARTLQASALGVFYSVTSLAAVVGLIAAHGYPSIAARFMLRYREQGKEGLVAAFVRVARRDATLYAAAATVGRCLHLPYYGRRSAPRRGLLSSRLRCRFRPMLLSVSTGRSRPRSGASLSLICPTPASGRSCCSAAWES